MAEREYTVSIKADPSGFQAAFKAATGIVAEFSAGLKDGFKEGMEEVRKSSAEVDRFSTATKRAADESANIGTKAISSWDSIALKITGAVAAFDLAGKAMAAIGSGIDAVFAGISRGADLDDLSQRLGVAVEQLSALELSATLGGVSMESMGTGMQALARGMSAAASGGKEAQAAFAAVGISAGEIADLSTDEVLQRIADKFAGTEDGAAKTALAMDLLGKAGAQMIPVLNEGAAGLAQQAQLAQQLGLVLDGETAQAMGNAADAVDILGLAVTGVQNQLASGMAPALSRAADMVVDFVANIGIADGRLQDLGNVIGTTVADSIENLIGLFDRLSAAATEGRFSEALLAEMQGIGPAVEPIARDIGIKIGGWIAEGVKSAFRIDWAALMEGAAAAAPQGGDPFVEWANSRKKAIEGAFDVDIAPLTSSVDGVAGAFGRLQQAEAGAAAQTAAANSAFSSTHEVIGQMADGTLILGKNLVESGEAAKKGAIGYQQGGDAASKAADAIEKLRERFAEQIRTQTEAVEKMEGQNEALQQIIDGNLSAADAQTVLNDATGEAAAVAALAAGATADEAAELGNLAISAAEAAQRNRELNATRNAQVDTGYLREERDILEQVIAGTKSRIDAEHELAVLRERRKLVDADVAENLVKEREATEDAREAYEKIGETGEDAWKGIDEAFNKTLDGLIAGTLDMQDIWRSFATGLVQDFAQSMGGVSGIFEKVVGGFKGIFSGNAGLKDKDGNPVGFLKSIGGGTDRFVGQDGSFSYGAAAGAAAQGGATAYSLFRGISDTGLEGIIAKGTEAGVISAANGIGQVFGTIIGAVASIYLGPIGGIIGGIAGSGLSALIGDAVNRDALLQGHLDRNSFLGRQQNPGYFAFDPAGSGFFTAQLVDVILNLPTLGLALRKGGEALLDQSETFAAAQSRFGDITVRSGGPRDVYRNNLTGADTARERGFTDAQIDLTLGATSAIFNQLAEGEMAEDAGRLGEAMGQIMAEFLSRGLEDGVEFEGMFDLLRQFAHEAGIDVLTSLGSLDDILNNSMAAAQRWGKVDPMAAATQGARAYAEALIGATTVFRNDYPIGVNLTAIALRNMEKDGVNAFGEIDDEAKKTLFNLAKDTQLTTDIIAKLVEQGFRIDTEEFERQLSAISQSAAFLGQNFAGIFDFDSAAAGVEAIFQKLKGDIFKTFQQESMTQLFEGTDIASAFEPVYAALDRIDEFDLTTATGAQDFMAILTPALAEGKANLQDYLPVLQVMIDNWKEIQKIIDEAMKPDVFEQAAIVAEEAFGGIGGALSTAIDAGLAVLEDGGTWDQAVGVFDSTFGAGVEKSFKDAIFNAIVQSAVIEPLIATMQPAFQYVVAAGLVHGFGDERVQQAFDILLRDAEKKAKDLGLIVFKAKVDSEGITSDIERAFNDAADYTLDWASDVKGQLGSALDAAFDVIASGGTRDEAIAAWGDALGDGTEKGITDGIVRALINAALIDPFIEQWAPVIQFWTAGAIEKGVNDPKVKEAQRLLFGPDSEFQRGLNSIPGIAIDWYWNYAGGDAPPGYEDKKPTTDNGKGTNSTTSFRGGFAMGGAVPHGSSFIVGEAGPELVLTDGSGSTIIPLDPAVANSMLNGGVAGYEDGSVPRGHGPVRNPGGGYKPTYLGGDYVRGGPVRPYVPPRERPGEDGGSEVELSVSFSFENALDEFFRGGTRKDLRNALAEATGEGILQGMMDAALAQAGLDAFQEEMAATIEKAMEDGTLDASELEGIEEMGKDFKAKLVDMADELGPAFKIIAEAFGIDIGQEVKDAITPAAQASKDLIGGALRSAFRDPANLNYETFSAALREAVYGNIVDGLIAAFIDAAVIQGALAPMLAVITEQFGNLGAAIAAGSAEGISTASAIIMAEVANIAGILDDPAFKAAIQSLLDLGVDIAEGLGISLNTATDGINYAADGFQNAADAAANACTGECDLEQKLVTTNEKLIALDGYGRVGGSSDSYYEYVERPTRTPDGVDLPDTLGGGNNGYGDEDWRRSQAWRRERARERRRNRTYYDPDIPQMAEGGIVTGPTVALIGEAGPEAVIPLSGAESTSDLVRELRALRDEFREELRSHGEKTVSALEADRHTEVKMNEQTLIDAWTQAKRVADKAGIPFGG